MRATPIPTTPCSQPTISGKAADKYLLLEAPESIGQLYEEEISLEGLPFDAGDEIMQMVGMDGILYVLLENPLKGSSHVAVYDLSRADADGTGFGVGLEKVVRSTDGTYESTDYTGKVRYDKSNSQSSITLDNVGFAGAIIALVARRKLN